MLFRFGLLVGPLGQFAVPATEKNASMVEVLAQVPHLRGDFARRSVKDIVGEKLALLIASGVLQVGDPLPAERELAAAFGVSRETVRGAVQGLAARGIVDVSHGSRTRVMSNDVGTLRIGITRAREINSFDIEDVHAARMLVEREVVGDAAECIDRETIARLEKSLAEQADAIDDPVRFLICDREFHSAIYHASRNSLLADFVMDLYTYVMEHRRRAMAQSGAIAQSYKEHLAIVESLRAHDRKAVVAAFERHLIRIYTTTKSILEETSEMQADTPLSAGKTGRGRKA
jgi:DNA-binding FadR family transcriptional regulator